MEPKEDVITIDLLEELAHPKYIKQVYYLVLDKAHYDRMLEEMGQEFIDKQHILCAGNPK